MAQAMCSLLRQAPQEMCSHPMGLHGQVLLQQAAQQMYKPYWLQALGQNQLTGRQWSLFRYGVVEVEGQGRPPPPLLAVVAAVAITK
jgi:hypothetical protein